MGGTGSVVQHDRGSNSRAGERSLLKLYNRNRRDDRLSNKMLANDGGPAKAMATVGDDAGRSHTTGKLVTGNGRAERVRARDRAMVQLYNGCHAGLGPALVRLRRSLRQCSINGTGWATVIAVAAVLEQEGVSADCGAVLTLADQGCDTYKCCGSVESTREPFPDRSTASTAVVSPETRLVHWPSIIDFLEDGLDSQIETSTTIPECKKRVLRSSSPETSMSQSRATRVHGEEQEIPEAAENKDRTRPAGANTKDECTDPETTPESNPGSDDRGFAKEGVARRQSEANGSSCDGFMLVNQGLFMIDAGLRELEFDGKQLSPLQIADAMDSVRHVLEVKAGMKRAREGDFRSTGDENESHDNDMPPENPEGTLTSRGVPEMVSETVGRFDTEGMVQEACMASKRGDVSALAAFADNVDLRLSDAFGRNALYYSSLCGHVQAAHFVAVHAYGGVKGIPETERWECRKNALSKEMRHYLDTGILPPSTPAAQASKSEESRPVQAVPVRAKCFSPIASARSRTREELPEIVGRAGGGPAVNDDEIRESYARRAAPPVEATISIASLFGWGHDREKEKEEEDY